jgi:hypothetical protein
MMPPEFFCFFYLKRFGKIEGIAGQAFNSDRPIDLGPEGDVVFLLSLPAKFFQSVQDRLQMPRRQG